MNRRISSSTGGDPSPPGGCGTAARIYEYLYLNPPEWDLVELNWGDQRRSRVGDISFDRENGLLYVLELYADGAKPVMHVWKVSPPPLAWFGRLKITPLHPEESKTERISK